MIDNKNPFTEQVIDYDNNQILKILRNKKKYSPKLFTACEIEAEARNILDQVNIEAGTNPFVHTVQNHATSKLEYIVKNSTEYNHRLVTAAKAELGIRNKETTTDAAVANIEPTVNIEKVDREKTILKIQQSIKDHVSTDLIIDKLMKMGYTEDEAISEIKYASTSYDRVKREKKNQDSKENGKISWWTIGIGIYFLVKIIIYIARS